ncbi:MAG: hypothetical protein O7G88_20005, partial [bacterium]|nr:hypothetical protein [bacterium]
KALLHTFEGHSSPVNSVAFSPDGGFLASASFDNTVKLWDVQGKALLHTFEGHSRSVNSVAFSPDGGFLASASFDNTVKLWDVEGRGELQTLLGGRGGNWIRVESRQRVFRGDDGTLLRKRATQNDDWLPVPVAEMSGRSAFSVSVTPASITIKPGESAEVRIQITNTGSRAAYWLHLKSSTSGDEAIRLTPPNRLFKGKGQQEWKASRIAKLEKGKSAALHARVVANLKLPAAFLDPGIHQLMLTVTSASGVEVSQTISVGVQSPYLEWRTAQLEQDKKTLKIGLYNTGAVALRDFTLELYAPDVVKPLSQQTIAELAPATPLELAVVLPDDIDPHAQALTLQGRTRALPVFSWNLTAPDITGASRISLWLFLPILPLTLVALVYLRRYRHPLVVQLSGEPALLLQLPPEQLQEAQTRLKQTRRLDTVLSKTEVTQRTLDAGIAFFGRATPEEKAQRLARRIGGEVSPLPREDRGEGLVLYELRLPDDFPLNLDRCLLGFPATDSAPQDFLADLRGIPQTRLRVSLLISPSSDYQRQLYERTQDRSNKWVAPSRSELTNLLLSPTPATVLANLFASQLALTQLSPYQLGGGVNREVTFFGRQEIIAHIMNRDPANYLVVSGRQLGKSSLLKALERRYQEQPEIICHYLTLSSEILVPRLASALQLPRDTGLEEIAAYVVEAEGRFLFLIDEADKFIAHELENAYPILDALRRMSEEGHCNFILAGFWELYEHAVLDYQSPLKNFGEIIQIGALEAEACRQLAIEPMQSMRLAYANPALAEQLLETTGQRANLMAIACHEILTQLQPEQRVIEAAAVQRSLHSEKTFNALKGWDAMTDDKAACQLDRIVVYGTIEKERFDFAELVTLLNQHGLTPDGNALERSLLRLELGFVLGRDDRGNYFYRVPLFRELILKDSPAVKLKVELDSWKAIP